MKMLYFYHVGAYDYEGNIQMDYYSNKKYTQEEFENILFNVLNELMNNILENTPESVCFQNIYYEADDLLLEKRFDKLMLEQGFHRVSKELTASVIFTTHHKDNKYDKKLTDLFLELDIDETCKEKNCNRLPEFSIEDKKSQMKMCGVTLREKLRGIKK